MTTELDVDAYDGRRPMPTRHKAAGAGRKKGQFHMSRSKAVAAAPKSDDRTPRFAASYDPKSLEKARWLAAARGVPLAMVLRDALDAYTHVIETEADAKKVAALMFAVLKK